MKNSCKTLLSRFSLPMQAATGIWCSRYEDEDEEASNAWDLLNDLTQHAEMSKLILNNPNYEQIENDSSKLQQ